MKAQSSTQLPVLEPLFNAIRTPATTGRQVIAPLQVDATAMVVDAEPGSRAPSMSVRSNVEAPSNSIDQSDEFFLLMALDNEVPVNEPANALADAMRESEARQPRSTLNWPPLTFSYPVLVVPAERLEAIRVNKDSGRLAQPQQGLSGPGLDAALRTHCIAPPIVPAPAVTPAQAKAQPVPVTSTPVPAILMTDDGGTFSVIREESHAGTAEQDEIVLQLHTCRKSLAASGTFAMQCLIDLLADNGGARNSHFHGGETARMQIAREIIDLLFDMVAMHGTPKARFDQASLDRVCDSLLQWYGRSSYALSRIDPVRRYTSGMHNMVDENIINTFVLHAMCRSEKMRDFMLGKFSSMETELKSLFKMSAKIDILRQWSEGEIALSPAELRALCMLKLSSNSSSSKLLYLVRSYAGQLSLPGMNQGDKQGASAGFAMQ